MIGIYKWTNKINNKVYVGQSKNIEARTKKHIWDANNNKGNLLEKAINKYGLKNFKIEVIEECKIEELDEKEKFYIKTLNSIIPHGYNLTWGGKLSKEEIQPFYNLSEEKIKEIIELLKDSELTITAIANKYNVLVTTICQINEGIHYVQNEIEYPIRKKEDIKDIAYSKVKNSIQGEQHYKASISNKEALEIIEELLNTDKKMIDIASDRNIGIDVVKDINRGKSWKFIERPVPCRKNHGNNKISEEEVQKIKILLKENKKSYLEIVNLFENCTLRILNRINIGENWHDDREEYPLRKFKKSKGKLTNEQVLDIIDSYKKGISVIELSKKYNVSTQSIYDIINHKTYKYLTEL